MCGVWVVGLAAYSSWWWCIFGSIVVKGSNGVEYDEFFLILLPGPVV